MPEDIINLNTESSLSRYVALIFIVKASHINLPTYRVIVTDVLIVGHDLPFFCCFFLPLDWENSH